MKTLNAPFPYSDSDVAKCRVVLLSIRPFPFSDSDSDVAFTKFGLGF